MRALAGYPVDVRTQRLLLAVWIAALAASAGTATCALAPRIVAGRAEEMALGGIGFELFLGLIALAGATLSPGPIARRLGLGRGRQGPGLLALLVLGTIALSHALDTVIDLSGLGDQGSLAELDSALRGVRGHALWLALVGLGLAPGLAEELLCRGLVQRGLAPRLGAPAAVVLAALFFGALHVDPVHAAFAAVLGLYLGTVAHLAGSVRPAIVCHAANNLCAVLAAAFLPDLSTAPAASIALGAGFALAALAFARLQLGDPPPLEESSASASAGTTQLDPTGEGRIGRL